VLEKTRQNSRITKATSRPSASLNPYTFTREPGFPVPLAGDN
jgi:hypothetical protein